MYRIDNATAADTLPKPTDPGVKPNHYWSNGDPQRGLPGTIVDAEWLNMIQEELCKIIEGSGLKPDKASRAQLLQAINTLLEQRVTAPIHPGMYGLFAYTNIPRGWLICNGAAINRVGEFAKLFEKIGETYGKGDGTTTFNLPDFRGEFARGLDPDKGVDPGRKLGVHQMDAFQGHQTEWIGRHLGALPDGSFLIASATLGIRLPVRSSIVSDGAHGIPRIDKETRPRNHAWVHCISY